MPYHWENRKKMADVRGTGLWGHVCWFLSVIFAIIGIIAAATGIPIGLGATNWFLLAAIALLFSVTCFISWAVAWYLAEKK